MERIEWTNEWWEDANNLDATRWALIGDSVARQFRGTLQEMLAPRVKVDFFATSLIGNDLLEKRLRSFFEDTPYEYEVVLLNIGFHHGWNLAEGEWTEWYENMLNFVMSKCDKCVVLSGTHHEKLVNQELVLDEEINKAIENKNRIVYQLAQKYCIGYVDLYTYFKTRREIYPHSDHCHFARNADMAMAKKILRELNYGKEQKRSIGKRKEMPDKHFELFQLMNQWLINKQQGKEIATYFEKLNYKKIAIYGMSYVGERLYYDLKNSGIEVTYAIDKRADKVYTDLEVYTLEDELPEADVIVVTAITFYDEIEEAVMDVTAIPVVSLEDIIYGL